MRLKRLDLIRYGCFTDVSLDFPVEAQDFHVVFGCNEAGKSTSLAAIEDLLFGIPHNSPYKFLHDYSTMRIGGVLEQKGDAREIRRRKGNRDTLLGPDETPLGSGESALTPFLGGSDLNFFSRMFCMNHERLSRGGREILDAKDEVGQTLFSAGTGIAGLREQVKALSDAASELWTPRRSSRRKYYQAADALTEADNNLREHMVSAKKWLEAKRSLEDAQQVYDALVKKIEIHSSELRKLARIRRVYRMVCRLAELREELDSQGDVVLLPEDAEARVRAAQTDQANADAKIEELSKQLAAAKTEYAQLSCDEAILLRADDIKQLHMQRIEVQKAERDLPQLRAHLNAAEARLGEVAEELKWPAESTDETLARIPGRADIAAVRRLLAGRAKRLSAVDSAKAALQETVDNIEALRRELQSKATARDISVLDAVLRSNRHVDDIATRIRTAEKELELAQRSIENRFSPMRPKISDVDALLQIPVPAATTVQEHRDELRDLEQQAQECSGKIASAERDRKQYEQRCEQIKKARGVVEQHELVGARRKRDQGWSIIRKQWGGEEVAESELEAFSPEGELLETYERMVELSDSLADQRFETAEAAGQIGEIQRKLDEQRSILEGLYSQKKVLERGVSDWHHKWRQVWTEAPFVPLAPDSMLAWLSARADVLQMVEQRDRAQVQLAGLQKEEREASAEIIRELEKLGEDVESIATHPFKIVFEAGTAFQKRNEKLCEEKLNLEERISKRRFEEQRKSSALETAHAELAKWLSEWREALSHTTLDVDSTPEALSDQLGPLDELRECGRDVEKLRHERIEKIEQDSESFAKATDGLVRAVATDLSGKAASEAALELERRSEEAQRSDDQRKQKEQVIGKLEERVQEFESDKSSASEALTELKQLAGVKTIAELEGSINRSELRRHLESERKELERVLDEQGDGLPTAALHKECDEVDLDEIVAREEAVGRELDDLRKGLSEATEGRVHARQIFQQIGGADRAARAAAERQEALATMRDIAEDYVRLGTAAMLLQWTIDRYRKEKQAPLLKRAGEIFSVLTSGSFTGLRLTFDDSDRARLAGLRSDESLVPVEGMSDGSSDQLYLALRLASVEEYMDGGQVLPFVADDLLINFDNNRAAAGFKVLGQLSQKTQVLFFTHHEHLVDIARSTLGDSVNVITLDRRDEASAA